MLSMRLCQYAHKMGERSLKAVLRTFNLCEFLPIYKSTYLKVNTAPAIQALNALSQHTKCYVSEQCLFQVCMAYRLMTNRKLSVSELRELVSSSSGNILSHCFPQIEYSEAVVWRDESGVVLAVTNTVAQ